MIGENVSCSLIKLLNVSECKIEKKVNTHGRAMICGYLSAEEEEKQLLANASKQSLEQIYILDEKREKKCLFTGIVENLKVEVKADVRKAWIVLVSGTILLDSIPKIRVFQNNSMSYGTLFQQITQN